MGLRLTLRPNERVIINGCVIKNGPRRQVFEIENRADVLRGEDMLDEVTASTPVRRIAYQIQIALVSRAHRAEYVPIILSGLTGLLAALPRFSDQISLAEAAVMQSDFYAAFRALAPVMHYEEQLFTLLKGPSS